jgi:hypothetical protein
MTTTTMKFEMFALQSAKKQKARAAAARARKAKVDAFAKAQLKGRMKELRLEARRERLTADLAKAQKTLAGAQARVEKLASQLSALAA